VRHLLVHAKIPMTARYAHSLANARWRRLMLEALIESQPAPNRPQEFNVEDSVGSLGP